MCYLSICLYFFYFCQVIGTPSFPLLSVMRPSLQKYWRSTKYSTRKCSTIHTLPVICSHSVLQCLLQTTSLQIIANAINIKSLLFVILQQNISGSHPAGTLCKLHATKTKGLEYISFSEWLTVPLLYIYCQTQRAVNTRYYTFPKYVFPDHISLYQFVSK